MQVSVVIPTYNGARFLAEAVESVWRQTLSPVEIIVVDDCSTDGTASVAAALAGRSPVSMSVITRPRNSGGPAVPIATGLARVRSDYVVVLDQDDVLLPDRLRDHVTLLEAEAGLTLAVGFCQHYDVPTVHQTQAARDELADQSRPAAGPTGARCLPGRQFIRLLFRHHNFVVGFPGFTFRKADWAAQSGPGIRLRVASDLNLLCWLARKGDVGLIPRPGYRRRWHANNLSRDAMLGTLELVRVFDRHLAADPALARDPGVRAEARALFIRVGQDLAASGSLWDALQSFRAATRLGGVDTRMAAVVGRAVRARASRLLRQFRTGAGP